jgi:hypothetical protein
VIEHRPAVAGSRSWYREFESRRDGMIYAMEGGLWLHRHVWKGTSMAHLISTDRLRLDEYGKHVGLPLHRLQFKPLKDPRNGVRRDAWHWDLVGRFLPACIADTVNPEDGDRHTLDSAY